MTGNGGSEGSVCDGVLMISSFSQALISMTEINSRILNIHVVSNGTEH